MLWGNYAAAIAVSSLGRREHSLDKARRSREHFPNSSDFDNVYTDGNDHKRNRIAARRVLLARTRRRAGAGLWSTRRRRLRQRLLHAHWRRQLDARGLAESCPL